MLPDSCQRSRCHLIIRIEKDQIIPAPLGYASIANRGKTAIFLADTDKFPRMALSQALHHFGSFIFRTVINDDQL
ncbi:hypothetical protein PT85_10440 [Pseudomonas flexibilis]|uniref:Uncharacterized protein n=1 Tax=Pseudomonas flexibilis TaxID=706570 RepID=A0A0B3BPR6_9PSED|nr:hypothetical protein PT85_10440 [Pseudomonas flexibilis]